MKSIHLILTLIVALATNQSHGRAIDDMNNSVQSNDNEPQYEQQDWVKITKAPPPKIIHASGTITKIECEVMGSPTPTIEWIRGNIPFSEVNNYAHINVSMTIFTFRILKFSSWIIMKRIQLVNQHHRLLYVYVQF